jgi:hypothetical protein
MSDREDLPDDEGLAEGGGSGGGTESVHQERRRVSAWRGPVLVFITVLAVLVVVVPVVWIAGYPFGSVRFATVLWITVLAIGGALAMLAIYSLTRRNV